MWYESKLPEEIVKGQYLHVCQTSWTICVVKVIAISRLTNSLIAVIELNGERFNSDTDVSLDSTNKLSQIPAAAKQSPTSSLYVLTNGKLQTIQVTEITYEFDEFEQCEVYILDESEYRVAKVASVDNFYEEQAKICTIEDLKGMKDLEDLYDKTTGIPHLMDGLLLADIEISSAETHDLKKIQQQLGDLTDKLNVAMSRS